MQTSDSTFHGDGAWNENFNHVVSSNMSTAASTWTWDSSRQKYYYWNPGESVFVYQDGTQLAPYPETTVTSSQSTDTGLAIESESPVKTL